MPTTEQNEMRCESCERLRAALTNISRQAENVEMKHVDFRVWAKHQTDEALNIHKRGGE